jgi:hypothetical protein
VSGRLGAIGAYLNIAGNKSALFPILPSDIRKEDIDETTVRR